MNKNTGIAFGNLPLAALLGLGMAIDTCAAAQREAPLAPTPAPAAQRPAEELEELAEIWVSGKRLLDHFTDAEEEFFPIYNKVNKNSCPP